ncbi:MAG: cell division protein ZapE [Rhodomicrobium sp.]|nr:cell division protein ZapE [Rhodomicrobium sp.]
MAETLLERYRGMVRSGEIAADPAQALAVEKLQILSNRLARYTPPAKTDVFSFFTRKSGEVPRGLYIFGKVGRGKTMLMDVFFEAVPFGKKRRVHFHEFMGETHELIGAARKSHPGDPVPQVAERIAREAPLLCFDEFHVTDIADAMILGRLFSVLFERGTVIVATSNVPPWDLYKNGLNRALFVPFIELIEMKMEVLELEASQDYRLNRLTGTQLYFTPLGPEADQAMRAAWAMLTGREAGEPMTLTVKGHRVDVPEAAMGVARFTFEDLCAKPLGATDYLTIARNFHTVLIEQVPILTPDRRNEARRFNTLIDALYDQGVGVIISADAEPDSLYRQGDGAELFQRTASRLMEMRSEGYLAARRRQR